MVRMVFLRFSFLARSLSFCSRPSSLLRKTTKLPILQDLLAAVALSSFLTRPVKLSLISRAKIMATGLLPFCQTRQFFWPALEPLTFSGWKGVMLRLPSCGPDLTSAAVRDPPASSSAAARAPVILCVLIVENFLQYTRTDATVAFQCNDAPARREVPRRRKRRTRIPENASAVRPRRGIIRG